MSQNKRLFEDVRTQVMSVLVAAATRPLSSVQLNNDFKEITGGPIPYYRLGYPSLEELLLDLHDDVHVIRTNRGFLFTPVLKEGSAHIAKLVQGQKQSKQPKNSSISRYQKPPRMSGQQYGRSSNTPGSNASGSIPAFVQSYIVELLQDYPAGVSIMKFGELYESRYHFHISPTSYGFTSWPEMFESMRHTIIMKNAGHVIFVHLKEHLLRAGRQDHEPVHERPQSRPNSENHQVMNSNNPPNLSPAASSPCSAGSPETVSYCQEESSAHISDKMKATFREIISMHKEGLWCSHLPEKYEEFTKHSLDPRDLGFYSVIEMVTALNDIFTPQKTVNTSDWLLFDARIVKPEPKTLAAIGGPTSKDNSDLHPVPLMYQRRVLQVISSYEKGMFTSDFDSLYTKFFGEALKPEKFGFYSTELLLKSLTHSLEMTPLDNERIIVRVLPNVRDFCDKTTLKNLEDLQKRGVPDDAITGPFKIAQQEIDAKLLGDARDKYIPIYVTSVCNPGDFWVQLRGKPTSAALDTLMDNLEEFYYGALGEFYYIPFSDIVTDMVCVATYPEDNNWHRCTVNAIKSKEEVELFYIDYGSYATVNANVMRYMMKDFAKLPAQGIQAYLANILPANGQTWSLACRNKFSFLVNDKPLMALVATAEIIYPLALYLCDTTCATDVHINDTLVSEGLAQQCIFENENAETLPDPETNREMNCMESIPENESLLQICTGTSAAKSHNGQNTYLMDYCKQMLQVEETTRGSKSLLWSKHRSVVDAKNKMIDGLRSGNRKNIQSDAGPVYIRNVNVSEQNTVHIININGKSYFTSADLSSILWPDYGADVLKRKLMKHNLEVPMLEVTKWTHGHLLEQLSKIKTLDRRFCYNGTSRQSAYLCPVESLSMILDTFTDTEFNRLQVVLDAANDFKPNNTVWCKI